MRVSAVWARLRVARWTSVLVLAAGILLVGAAAALTGTRITGYILDETIIKQSAVHYSQAPLYNLFHDVNARATSRLYSLLIAPLFALADGDVAVRLARGLNGPLFASAAIPVYVLARQVVRSRALAVAAALGTVACPWLVLTTAMFTENLAYPLFAWCLLAMFWAVTAPSAPRDALAVALLIAATCTRTQMVALFGAYAILVAMAVWRTRPRPSGPLADAWLAATLRRFPVSIGLAVLVVLSVAFELHRGTLSARLNGLLGGYAQSSTARTSLPTDWGISAAVELLAVSLGTGIVAPVLAIAWYVRACTRPYRAVDGAVAAVAVTTLSLLVAATLVSQGAYLDAATEERYFIYAVPVIWIGAVAALESRSIRARGLLEAGGLLAVVALLVPLPRVLDLESSYFAPGMVSARYGLDRLLARLGDALGQTVASERDALSALVLLGLAAATVAWRWAPRRGPAIALAAGAALQLALTGVAFAAINGRVHGVPGRTGGGFGQLGFIDRAVGGDPVSWLDAQPRADESAANTVQRTALLYNDAIAQRLAVPGLAITPDNFPLNSLPLVDARIAEDGRLAPVAPPSAPTRWIVQTSESPFLHLAGVPVTADPGHRLELVRAAQPVHATWLASGLSPAGALAPGGTARLRRWGAGTVTMRVVASASARVRVTLGGVTRSLTVAPGAASAATVQTCGAAARGTLRASGAVTVERVKVSDGDCG